MLSQILYRLGRLAGRRPWVVIATWLAGSLLVVGAAAGFGEELEDSFGAPGLDSQRAADLLSRSGSDERGLTAHVVVTPTDERATFFASPQAVAGLAELQAELTALPHVLGTGDPASALEADRSEAVAGGFVSPDGRVALVRVQYPALDELTPADLENLKEVRAQLDDDFPLQVEMGGDLFFAFESPEAGVTEALGLVAALLILLVAFGSIVAAGLPIGMAVFGLVVGVSALGLVAHAVDVPAWAPVLGSMVGLGVGIDYALFVVTRHREFLARGLDIEESIGRAVATAGQAVVFAGGIVVVSILGLAVAGVPFMTAGGIAISVIVLVMVLASLTLLPAFLGLAGHRINRSRRRTRPADSTPGAGWERWLRHVTAHPRAYLVGTTVLLLGLAAPVTALRVGIPDDGALPETRTERVAYDLLDDAFGPGSNGPLVLAVDISRDPEATERLAGAVATDPGIAGVRPPDVDASAGVATIVAIPTTGPQDAATHTTIERLRTEVIPAALGTSPAHAHVGGQTATFADVGERVHDRLPLFIAAVVLMAFLLLVLVFRSVVVPLKAALLNLLSIGAAYGVMVMVFQWGWGAGLIGLETTVPIVSFIPMFMFAILFGLSMDYEVFLLSRVREEYVATGDNAESVVRGIARTGRVITSAALIMISVFFGFVLGQDAPTKMFGLGLATAILVDATLVRMVLVPATMKLLGDANWWLPRWLDRALPHLETDGQRRLGSTQYNVVLPDTSLATASNGSLVGQRRVNDHLESQDIPNSGDAALIRHP